MNELTIGDKIYVSSKRAAEITGYAKDYVGQLCREGHVEARMVGRSWYVLESSIREHRFGKKEEVKEEIKPSAPEVSLPSAWEPSTYVSETVSTIPVVIRPPKEEVVAPVRTEMPSEPVEEPALNEMQHAWREWFETRRELDFTHPKPVEEVEEEETEPEEEIALPIQRIREPVVEERAKEVRINRAPEPVVTISPPIHRKPSKPRRQRRSSAGANMIVIALLVVLAGIAISVAVINTGYADPYLNNNPVIKFLGGTSNVQK